MPEINSVGPLASRAHHPIKSNCDIAVFIGPKKSFSQTVFRNVEAELEEIEPVRYETVLEFLDAATVAMMPARLIIVDASILEDERDQFNRLLAEREALHTGLEPPGIVVAYMHEYCVQKVFASLGQAEGLQGVLPMNQSIDIWLAVMRLLLSGGTYFPADVLDSRGLSGAKPDPVSDETSEIAGSLTQREIAVMKHVMHGLQNKQIAEKLAVSEHTIKLHIHHVITKLKVSNRTAAAMKFLEVMPH